MSIPDKVVAGLKETLANVENKSGGRSYKVRLHSPGEIQKLRNRLGMTQKDFAEQLGVSFQTVQKWEQGTRRPEGAANSFLAVIKRIPHEVIAALRADRAERINLDEDVREATSCADMCEATSARPGDDVRKGREAWRKGWHDPRYSREQHETWRKAWDDSRYSHRVSRDDVREVIYQLLWMGRFTRGIAGEDVHRDFYSRFVETMTCSNADETREAVDHALVRLNAIENQRAASKAE